MVDGITRFRRVTSATSGGGLVVSANTAVGCDANTNVTVGTTTYPLSVTPRASSAARTAIDGLP